VNNELKSMGKEVVVVCLKILSQNLPRVTEHNHEEPRSVLLTNEQRSKASTF
jgi:hypothetical protein